MSTSDTLSRSCLSLAGAERLAELALQAAHDHSANICIAITDGSGQLLLFKRMDRAVLVAIDVALGKARTAAQLGMPAINFERMINAGETAMLTVPGVVPLAGGAPLIIEGECVGAIGISGSDSTGDEAIANAAIAAFSGEQ